MKTESDEHWLDTFEANLTTLHPLIQKLTTPTEGVTLDNVRSKLGNIPRISWSSIDDNIFFPKDKVHKDGEQIGVGR